MINLNHLRVFYHVAKNKSYTLSAGELFISQPAVTNHVKALEDQWNMKLFGKKGKRIYLSEEGKSLFEYTKKLFEYEKKIEQTVEEIRSLKRGILRIGSPKTFRSLIAFTMDSFHQHYPDVQMHFVESSSLSLTHNLLNHDLEIGLISKVEDSPAIDFAHFCHEEILFLVGPTHFLAKEGSVSLEELSKIPIIRKGSGSGTGKVVLDLFKNAGHDPNIYMETTNNEFIIELLQREGVGAFLSEASISNEIDKGLLVNIPIEDHTISLEIYVAYLKDHLLSLPAKEFLKTLWELRYPSEHFKYLVPTWPPEFPFLDRE